MQLWRGVFVFAATAPGMSTAFPFWLVAIPTWVCTVLMFTMYRQEYRKSGDEGRLTPCRTTFSRSMAWCKPSEAVEKKSSRSASAAVISCGSEEARVSATSCSLKKRTL